MPSGPVREHREQRVAAGGDPRAGLERLEVGGEGAGVAIAALDTVTSVRSAIRALLRIVDDELGAELRSCCKRDDDYVAAATFVRLGRRRGARSTRGRVVA